MKRFVVFFVFIHCCTLFLGCKKDEVSFKQFEGNWKAVSYNYSQGIKSFGTQNAYYIKGDSFYYKQYNQYGHLIALQGYKLEFSIQTVLKGESTLLITEIYNGLDSAGNVVLNRINKNEINLIEGQSEYGHSTNNQSIKADRIKTYLYDWSGMEFYITSSEFVRF